jgi:hypothetical protein
VNNDQTEELKGRKQRRDFYCVVSRRILFFRAPSRDRSGQRLGLCRRPARHTRLVDYRANLSLFGYLAADHQHRHDHRHIPDGVFNSKHSEP